MRDAICVSASFENATLSNANFSGSKLLGANFVNANLTDANFEGTNLCGANFKGANLTNANFTNAIYAVNTFFDPGVNPESLGMKIAGSSQVSAPIVQPTSSPRSATKEDSQDSSNHKKTKEIWYRGSRMTVGIEEKAAETEEQEPVYKEIWYRGSRTLVEVKRAEKTDKPGMNYRGVKS